MIETKTVNSLCKTLVVFLAIGVLFFSCRKLTGFEKNSDDAYAVFDELWKQVDEHYALFDIKKVDWTKTGEKYRQKISPGLSEAALFRICSDMLEELKDGHVSLISSFDTATYENFYRLYPPNFKLNTVLNNYLKNIYETSGPFIYKMEGGIGYVLYQSFASSFSDDEINKVMSFLSAAKGIIIDVRSNTGGKLNNVVRLVNRFISRRTLVKYELHKSGPGHSSFFEASPFYIDPAGTGISKPIVVLTNRSCFSACNDFVLYMSTLPNSATVGDQTGGGGGLPSNYILMNGWKLQYTSSVTLSPNKLPVEEGLNPSFKIDISPIDEVNGRDPILEKAISILQ